MAGISEFVSMNMNEDVSKLLLSRKKWPDNDMDLAVNCIESRRKLKGKVQEWYEIPELIFPAKLSAEQCSSSATARCKAAFAEHIAGSDNGKWRIADLTGGLGVDSWFYSRLAEKVLYNEMQSVLCEAARHNFKVLKADNITISNQKVGQDGAGPEDILEEFRPDIVYMDPARRGEGGKKVFLIEDCTPDVLKLKDEIFRICRHILLKLSPMADISMVCERLGSSCREVHAVAYGGECKELLVWMDREWDEEYSVSAVELPGDYPSSGPSCFRFRPSEERDASGYTSVTCPHRYIFEPGKALMKAGAFNLIGQRLNLHKLGRSTHYYFFEDESRLEDLKKLGKTYIIIRSEPLDKRTLKAAGKDFPKSEVTARNIPMDTETLRKKIGATSGDDAHIFGLRSDSEGNLLLCTKRVL